MSMMLTLAMRVFANLWCKIVGHRVTGWAILENSVHCGRCRRWIKGRQDDMPPQVLQYRAEAIANGSVMVVSEEDRQKYGHEISVAIGKTP